MMHRFAVLLLLTFSCSESKVVSEPAAATAPVPAQERAAAQAASRSVAGTPANGAVVRDPAGTEIVTVQDAHGDVRIAYTAEGARHQLEGTPRDSGKRKYTLDGSAVMFEIKPGDKGFKLRNAAGAMQWKVKTAPEKIKVGNNEEMNDAFELKISAEGLKIVAPGERLLGRVRSEGSQIVISDATGKETYRIDGPVSAAYGVLLLGDIPAAQRYILMAELMVGEAE